MTDRDVLLPRRRRHDRRRTSSRGGDGMTAKGMIGASVRRREDERLPDRARPVPGRPGTAGCAVGGVPAVDVRARAHSRDRRDGGPGSARRGRHLHRRGPAGDPEAVGAQGVAPGPEGLPPAADAATGPCTTSASRSPSWSRTPATRPRTRWNSSRSTTTNCRPSGRRPPPWRRTRRWRTRTPRTTSPCG